MGLTMKEILDKFNDCDTFSLTGKTSRYNVTISNEEYLTAVNSMNYYERQKFDEQFLEKYNITEEEYDKAVNQIEYKQKKEIRKAYENNKEKLSNYPTFDQIYEEIEQECYAFNNEKNREYYANKFYKKEDIEKMKQAGYSNEEIDKMKEDAFKYSFIADHVGKTTKYGNEYWGAFWGFYHEVASNIERKEEKEKYCITNGKDPVEQVPDELKKHLLYYEISFFNPVTIGSLKINYYFKLNEETKKYLLKFKNDFDFEFITIGLEDLAFYKNKELKFYSCTHEKFNSLEFDYQNMTVEEIIDFINDEYQGDNTEIINTISQLIKMEEQTKFTFRELGITDDNVMHSINYICEDLQLNLFLADWPKNFSIDEEDKLKENDEFTAEFGNVDTLIRKAR